MKTRMIEPHQLFFIIVQTQIGIGILSLPFVVHERAGKDGWLSILLAGLFVQIGTLIIVALAARFPDKTLYDYMPIVIGKWLSRLLIILFTLFFFLTSIQVLSNFLIFTSIWVFPRTPSLVFAVITAGITVYLIRENIQVIARFYVLASFLLVGILMVFVFMVQYLNWYNILPVGSEGAKAIWKGSGQALFSLSGFELLLWLFPLTKAPVKTKWKIAAGASLFSTIIYAALALFSYAFFSDEELKIVPEPVIYMVKAVELTIIERIDLVFLSLWAVFAITSFMSYLYMAASGAAVLVKASNHRSSVYVLAALSIPAALLIKSPIDLDTYGEKINLASPVFLFAIPFLIWIVALLRKKKEETC